LISTEQNSKFVEKKLLRKTAFLIFTEQNYKFVTNLVTRKLTKPVGSHHFFDDLKEIL